MTADELLGVEQACARLVSCVVEDDPASHHRVPAVDIYRICKLLRTLELEIKDLRLERLQGAPGSKAMPPSTL